MFKVKSKISLTFILIFIFLFIRPVSADGMAYVYIHDLDMFNWKLIPEDEQVCAINYENGIENMILYVHANANNLRGEKLVWIFPVPARPNEIKIDIIKGFPRLWGRNVKEATEDSLPYIFAPISLSQIYTSIPLVYIIFVTTPGMTGKRFIEEGITIHEHIEKMGLTTELITAEDGNKFYNYLVEKGLNLPPESKSILDEYVGKKYSFVVSWISDVEKFNQEKAQMGISINFPTNKIYFPLKPTSVYGNRTIPILIYVMKHVSPELYSEIKKHTKISYFIQSYYTVPDNLLTFFNGKKEIRNLKYTKIKINTPAEYLTKDLWIKDSAPLDIALADSIVIYPWLWGIFFFILASCLASMLAGMVVFRKEKPDKEKFFLFGLWNFLTLIGFAIATYIGKVDVKFTQLQEIRKNKVSFIRVLKLTLIITFALATLILFMELINEFINYPHVYIEWFISKSLEFYIHTIFIAIPFAIFIWGFYNSRKIRFITLFSVFFLIITGSLFFVTKFGIEHIQSYDEGKYVSFFERELPMFSIESTYFDNKTNRVKIIIRNIGVRNINLYQLITFIDMEEQPIISGNKGLLLPGDKAMIEVMNTTPTCGKKILVSIEGVESEKQILC